MMSTAVRIPDAYPRPPYPPRWTGGKVCRLELVSRLWPQSTVVCLFPWPGSSPPNSSAVLLCAARPHDTPADSVHVQGHRLLDDMPWCARLCQPACSCLSPGKREHGAVGVLLLLGP